MAQMGGPNFLSIWSFWITLPLALVVGNLNLMSQTADYNLLVWGGILVVVHLALGLIMFGAKKLSQNSVRENPKPFRALALFALLGLFRSFSLEILDPFFGPDYATFTSRLITNVIGGTLVMALIAIVVDDYRNHAQLAIEINRAKASLRWLNERKPSALRAADLDEIAKVRVEVERELRSGKTGAESIRQISERTVRTRSHYLAETTELGLGETPVPSRSGLRVVQSILGGLRWPNPIALAVLLELIALGAVAGYWGLTVAILNFFIAGVLIAAGAALLRHFMPLPSGNLSRPIVMASALGLLGLPVASVPSYVISSLVSPFPAYYAPAVTLILLIGFGISTWDSVTRDRENQRQLLMTEVSHEAELLEQLRDEVAKRRAAAADFLHGPIQSQLVASALRGESNEKALEAVERRFDEYALSQVSTDPRTQVTELVDAWSDLLDIKLNAEDGVWDSLSLHPVTSKLLTDILSEAITNIVRHGELGTEEVNVSIEASEPNAKFRLTVSSSGKLSGGIGAGSGLARLMDRGALISLEQIDGKVVLKATLS